MANNPEHYYVPEKSRMPVLMALAMATTGAGAALYLNTLGSEDPSAWLLILGVLGIIFVMVSWFNVVIQENHAELANAQVKQSFVMGMAWFIFSEVMFFFAFFFALFYIRLFSVDWLGNEGSKPGHDLLWPGFVSEWPLMQNPDPEAFPGPAETIPWYGIPTVNTLLLLSSSWTIHVAHQKLMEDKRKDFQNWMALTLGLGVIFLILQGYEYVHAYTDLGLTLKSGIYGTTFFLLTGFHGLHVTIGAIMLTIVLLRGYAGHFTPTDHFGLQAASWYWHFVDVVWLFLYLVVYIL
ncbi:MAG: cytochrome c oxidase subunit 3 [Gammaproteobacteria bacterium AqS3]|nr:cytochrome c oxidase subunit 3 [Gammaproteobacteria bacterium AqS3]